MNFENNIKQLFNALSFTFGKRISSNPPNVLSLTCFGGKYGELLDNFPQKDQKLKKKLEK
jgi:hypothetical protein